MWASCLWCCAGGLNETVLRNWLIRVLPTKTERYWENAIYCCRTTYIRFPAVINKRLPDYPKKTNRIWSVFRVRKVRQQLTTMRGHKKTKESGFFEGDSSDTDNMGKALKRTKVFTTSGEAKQRKIEYTQEELETHIRPLENVKGGNKLDWRPEIYTMLCRTEKRIKFFVEHSENPGKNVGNATLKIMRIINYFGNYKVQLKVTGKWDMVQVPEINVIKIPWTYFDWINEENI